MGFIARNLYDLSSRSLPEIAANCPAITGEGATNDRPAALEPAREIRPSSRGCHRSDRHFVGRFWQQISTL
jgi:hypothetical protein